MVNIFKKIKEVIFKWTLAFYTKKIIKKIEKDFRNELRK